MKKIYVLIILLLTYLLPPSVSQANLRCHNLFKNKRPPQYQATVDEVVQLLQFYPKFEENINKMIEAIRVIPISKKPITRIEEIGEQGSLRSYSYGDAVNRIKFENFDTDLKKQIIDVYNLLLNQEQFASYLKTLVLDAAVLMMKNNDQTTFKISDISNPLSAKLAVKTTKEEFLLAGRIDHQSLVKVLVDRIKSRGDKLAVIPKKGFSGNNTKTMKFGAFYEVLAYGPFFDRVFSINSSHGQERHLLQMDYVELALSNREQFWYNASKKGSGDSMWDTLFDGTNSTFMHPEFFGPYVSKHIPLY